MDVNDICKYIGYIVVAFIVFYLAVKSISFQQQFVEGFVKKRIPTEGFVNKKTPAEGFAKKTPAEEDIKQKPNENKTV